MRRNAIVLHRIVQHDILSGQLQQHRVVEELVDGHILRETLPPPGLHHELPGEGGGWLGLEGSDGDGFVEGISGNNLPVVEYGQTEGLSLRVCSQVGLEAEGVDGRDKGLDDVERGAGNWSVLCHVTSSSCEHCVNRRHTIGRRRHLYEEVGLHQPRSGHEKG